MLVHVRWAICSTTHVLYSKKQVNEESYVSSGVPPAQYLFERPPKVVVEDGVNDGVQCTVAVAKPEEELKQGIRHRAVLAERLQHVCKEKGKPADDKRSNDHCQDEREAFFPVLPALPAAAFGILHPLLNVSIPWLDLAQSVFSLVRFLFNGAWIVHFVVRRG